MDLLDSHVVTSMLLRISKSSKRMASSTNCLTRALRSSPIFARISGVRTAFNTVGLSVQGNMLVDLLLASFGARFADTSPDVS